MILHFLPTIKDPTGAVCTIGDRVHHKYAPPMSGFIICITTQFVYIEHTGTREGKDYKISDQFNSIAKVQHHIFTKKTNTPVWIKTDEQTTS